MLISMGLYTWISLVTFILSHVIFAQDIHLNDFMESVEGTKIKTKPGRHVCTTQKTISRPIPVLQKYKKPVYTPKPRECPNVSSCPQFDVSYELANRTVYRLQKSSTFETNCCPGWTKQDNHEKGCMRPICKNGCGDFGVCIKPDTCECRLGYSGPLCDTDIDECATHDHGCQHQCKNTAGSYMCACQEGFNLAPDGRTCLFCFTCQKEYQDLLSAIAVLSDRIPKQVPVTVDKSSQTDVQSLNSTIAELIEEVKRLSDVNIKLKGQMNELETQYEIAATDIEILQNVTRSTTPSPTTTTTTEKTTTTTRQTTTTTTSLTTTTTMPTTTPTTPIQTTTTTTPSTTTTTPSTTTTRTTTPEPTAPPTEAGLQFDTYDLIVSLSNQIGLMEEKLELCQCTRRSGRGFG